MHRHTDWLTQRQTDGEKKTQQKTKKNSTVVNAGTLSTICGGFHPKGLIVAS